MLPRVREAELVSEWTGLPGAEKCKALWVVQRNECWAIYKHTFYYRSVGCIIYEMCAQRPLFTGSTREQLDRSISEQQLPQFPDMFSAHLSHVWERWVVGYHCLGHVDTPPLHPLALNEPSQTMLVASEPHQNRSWQITSLTPTQFFQAAE